MKNQSIKYFVFLFAVGIVSVISSCKEEEPEKPTNEEELITTMKLNFFHAADSSPAGVFTFKDADGEGGAAPQVWDTIKLKSGASYFMEIELLNESNPVDVKDITTEVREEASSHLFCFVSVLSQLSVSYADSDGTHPIGLKTNWKALAPVNGSVTISLKHQPDGIKNGNCEPGDTDIEIVFPLKAQE